MNNLLNFTDLEDKEAIQKLNTLRDLVRQGESDRQERVERFVENTDIWLNNIWSSSDLDFFKELDITPYEFPVQRPLINNMISKQRNQPIGFEVVPNDINSYKRHRKGRELFVQEELQKENSAFATAQEAEEFYDKYADDKYAKASSVLLHNVRHESKATRVDSNVFQQGIISGLDFWKCTYSNKHSRNGSIEINRRPQNAIFYDESSVSQDLSDVEYIGEVHKLYGTNLVTMFPEHKEKIEKFFKHFTNKEHKSYGRVDKDWKYFYDFNYDRPLHSQVNVAEIWTLENEERIKVIDNDEGSYRIVEFGIPQENVVDQLMSMVLIELEEESKTNPEITKLLQQPNVKEQIFSIVEERFTIEITYEPVFYKAVFTYNALLEYRRSDLPHNSHPYYPFFAQFIEGEFRGLIDDIKDIIIAINKALAFRELMMSHGAKDLLVVDENTITQSGHTLDEVAEVYTSVGGLLALKLKSRQRIQDVFANINTVGDSLPAINALLADLDNRLYQISGVNLAQLGIVERETTNAGFRAQVQQGENNNGLIYDNFYSSLEFFYNEKVVPLVVKMMEQKPKQVIRKIGEEYEPWVELELEEDFDLFADAIRNGSYHLIAKPQNANRQIDEERGAKYMELALAGILDPEIAIEFSPDPNRYKILKKIREKELERARRQAYQQFSLEEFYQAASSSGLPAEGLEELIDKMKKEKMKQATQESGENIQRQQGGQGMKSAPNIRQSANETQRVNNTAKSKQ
jgi:hypothetical protein